MVNGLIGGQNDPPSKESDEADLVEEEEVDLIASDSVEEAAVPHEDDVPPSPVRLSSANTPLTPLVPVDSGSQVAAGKTKTSAQIFSQSRRHGGAAPE